MHQRPSDSDFGEVGWSALHIAIVLVYVHTLYPVESGAREEGGREEGGREGGGGEGGGGEGRGGGRT